MPRSFAVRFPVYPRDEAVLSQFCGRATSNARHRIGPNIRETKAGLELDVYTLDSAVFYAIYLETLETLLRLVGCILYNRIRLFPELCH